MASTAASRWSMSVHSNDKLALRLKLQAVRFYPVLSLPVVILYGLILCGCISSAPLIPNIFLFELVDLQSETSEHIRVGYFGICSSSNDRDFACSSSMLANDNGSATSLSTRQLKARYAVDLQRAMSFIPLLISAIAFFGGLVSILAHQLLLRVQKRSLTSTNVSSSDKHATNLALATRILFWVAAGVLLVAVYSRYCAISAVQTSTSTQYGEVIGGQIQRGISVEIMEWTAFALSTLLATCAQNFIRPRREIFTDRKSKLGRNRQDTVKLLSPPGQPLGLIDVQSISQQSSVEQSARSSLSRIGSMKQLISSDRLQAQSPAIGTGLLMPRLEERALSPLLPNFISEPGLYRQPVTHQKSQQPILQMAAEERPITSPLSPTFLGDHSTQGRPLTRTRSQRSYIPGGSGEVSPALPLQSILKMSSPTATPSVQSPLGPPLRPRTAPRSGQKNAWV